jgi:multisubunit Na+/H+ antiporter MnhG subunit
MRLFNRLSAAATGALLGLGIGLLVSDGRVVPLVALTVGAFVLYVMLRLFIGEGERATVAAVIALSFALHIAVAVLLYSGSLAIGMGGFISGDDRTYAAMSTALASYWHGDPRPPLVPPDWDGNAYLFGSWVYLESAIFYAVGPEPLVPIFLNAVMALVVAILAYDVARRLFGLSAALVALALVALFPSLVLWSSLNLKDALVLLLAGTCLWALVRFHETPRWSFVALALVCLVPLESARRYIFVGLAVLIPIALLLTPALPNRSRFGWSLAAAVVALVLVGLSPVADVARSGPLSLFEQARTGMSAGARTGFPETLAPATSDDLTLRTLRYLPIGLAYAVAAPFFWDIGRRADLLTIPEMALWYVLVVAALWTVWRYRRRWRSLSPLFLYAAGILLVLALVEGNVGTLFRHRAMAIPATIILASPIVAQLLARVAHLARVAPVRPDLPIAASSRS